MENTQVKQKTKQTHLSKKEREQQILEIVRLANEENMTLKAIAEKLDLKSGGNVSKKLERAGYKNIEGKYQLIKNIDSKDKENKEDTNEISDIIKSLKNINERLSKIETESKKGILVSNETMNYKAFSVRADESIMNSFNELAETFSNVSKSYLMSIAIKEFVEKYQDENKND